MNNLERIELLRTRLQQELSPTIIEITDDSAKHIGHPGAASGAGHFSLLISAPSFSEQTKVNCHRQIYAAIGDLIPDEVHALSITLAPIDIK